MCFHEKGRGDLCDYCLFKWGRTMKCVLCEGKLEGRTIDYEEFGVFLGRFKGLACNRCDEMFFDGETAKKIQEKSKELGLFGLSKNTRVAKVGNSLAIRVPKEI